MSIVLKDLDYSIHDNPGYGSWGRFEILQQDINNPLQFYDVCETFDLDIPNIEFITGFEK